MDVVYGSERTTTTTRKTEERGPPESEHSADPRKSYNLVFLKNFWVGPCDASTRVIRWYRVKKSVQPDLYVLPAADFSSGWNEPGSFPPGQNPLFIDLRNLRESRDSIKEYMVPVLHLQAWAVAFHLHTGRHVFVNCKLGQNRSAMFAIAVVVAYHRRYIPGKEQFTAKEALELLRKGRPMLKPQDWVWEGFYQIGYQPRPTVSRRRKRTRTKRLVEELSKENRGFDNDEYDSNDEKTYTLI